MIEVPLNSNPEQRFSIVLNETKYEVRVILNSRTGIWTMTLLIQNEEIVSGIALLPGVDIFEQYNLGIGRGYVVNLENPRRDPTRSGLGTNSKLFILTEEEIANGASV